MSTNYIIYNDAFNQIAAQQEAESSQFDACMSKLDNESASQAMVTIMTALLIVVSEYQESCMSNAVTAEDAIRVMNSETSEAQGDYNQYMQDWNAQYSKQYSYYMGLDTIPGTDTPMTSDWASQQATLDANNYCSLNDQNLINDAFEKTNDVESIASLPEFSSIYNDIKTQMSAFYSLNPDGTLDMSGTLSLWSSTGSIPNASTSDTTGLNNLNAFSNAFAAIDNDLQGLGNATTDEENLYKSQDDQATSLDSSLIKSYMDQITYMVNLQKVN